MFNVVKSLFTADNVKVTLDLVDLVDTVAVVEVVIK